MIYLLIIAAWLFTGWLGWRITILWWTMDSDMTERDRWELRWLLIAGPINLIASLLFYAKQYNDLRSDEVVYPRKDKQ